MKSSFMLICISLLLSYQGLHAVETFGYNKRDCLDKEVDYMKADVLVTNFMVLLTDKEFSAKYAPHSHSSFDRVRTVVADFKTGKAHEIKLDAEKTKKDLYLYQSWYWDRNGDGIADLIVHQMADSKGNPLQVDYYADDSFSHKLTGRFWTGSECADSEIDAPLMSTIGSEEAYLRPRLSTHSWSSVRGFRAFEC